MGQTQYIAATSVLDCFSIQHHRCIVMLLIIIIFVSKVISTLSGIRSTSSRRMGSWWHVKSPRVH